MGVLRVLVIIGAGALVGTADPAPRQTPPIAALRLAQAVPTPAPAAPADSRFESYLETVRARALAQGISAATLDRELAGLTPNPRVIELDQRQPDDSARVRPSFRNYIATRVTDGRVAQGRALAAELAPQLAAIEARYGVPAPILVAIWGLETNYGRFTGDFDLVRSLATLAWEGRRRALFEGELIAALKLIDEGRVSRERLVGSWAGATGQPQFLPSSYARYAADGDGDGRRDIWGNRADVLASIANYLKLNGWFAGGRWGHPAYVPPALERWRVRAITRSPRCTRPLDAHSRWIGVDEWKALGVVSLGGGWPSGETLATLVEPDGEGQGAYVTYGNYRAILAYNCANFYALSVGLLADRIAAAPASGAAGAAGAGGMH